MFVWAINYTWNYTWQRATVEQNSSTDAKDRYYYADSFILWDLSAYINNKYIFINMYMSATF